MSILTFADARHLVENQARSLKPVGTEVVPLQESSGRVVAEAVIADRDFPPFPRSTRDGYAVRSADLANLPARLKVIREIKAGASPEEISAGKIGAGEAAAIMTGAPLPSGADAVLMVEHAFLDGGVVEASQSVTPVENVVPQGAEAHAGDCLLPPGTRLEPPSVALAASIGKCNLTVYTKPQVAILATGDELVGVTAQPGPYEIRNSNSYSLAAQINACGARPLILPVARDSVAELRELIIRGLGADLLLITGGVSKGKYDLVKQALQDLQCDFFFTGALIQPGRPVIFGRVAGMGDRAPLESAKTPIDNVKLFFGLPGNPLSTMVTFELFVRAVIDALAGKAPQPLVFPQARLKSEVRTKPGLTRFLPAILGGEFENAEVEPVPWHGSGDMAAAVRANCYLVVPPDREWIAAGEKIGILIKN